MSLFVAFEWTQGAPQRLCLNAAALRNMLFMLFTPDTFQFEMSLLNDVAPWNMADMSWTFDTSHFEMSSLKAFAP